ncbi:MAG: glycosyltransferase [Geminocystis sp.]|nr:glycosyltransferase [Geminocystis sp.]HIK36482.1 glycosyl transferase [Geminocystis sp. M7585_C2015_104]
MMVNFNQNIHIFTVCAANYIPRARVLAESVKKLHSQVPFHLFLNDSIPPNFPQDYEPFDNIVTVTQLNIPNFPQWVFKHSVLESCTAIKPIAFQYLFQKYNCHGIIFLDPDVVVFSPLDELFSHFNHASILLTPHQLQPEKVHSAILDNEICFLRYGTFNLGFLGVKNSPEGKNFLQWWGDRCYHYCYDDHKNGIYTDQRWIDLVTSFFQEVKILRHPGYNVANWNLSHRQLRGDFNRGITVNNQPLYFYHFSNAQRIMPEKYKLYNDTLKSLLKWYQEKCKEAGEEEFSRIPYKYDYFDNGELITPNHRIVYRQNPDLQQKYPNPFAVGEKDCYYRWYQEYEREKKRKENESQYWIDKLLAELNKAYEIVREKDKTIDGLYRQLNEIIAQREEIQNQLLAIQKSKWWRIRKAWLKLKTILPLPLAK